MTKETENTLFPGRPNYTGPTKGWFGLLHHSVLLEKSHDVMERVDYVKREKPKHEVSTRLWNMIFIPDHLGDVYEAKRAPLAAEILTYIKNHIPDCAWNGRELVFPGAK